MAWRVERHQLLHQPAAGRGHQPQLAAIVREGSGKHSRLLEQIAVEPQRRDHIAGVVRHLGQALARLRRLARVSTTASTRLRSMRHPLFGLPHPPSSHRRSIHDCDCLFGLLHDPARLFLRQSDSRTADSRRPLPWLFSRSRLPVPALSVWVLSCF